MKAPVKKANASQRINALEAVVIDFNNKFNLVSDEMGRIGNAINILTENLNELINITGHRDELEKKLTDINVDNMKKTLEGLIESGAIERAEDKVITETSYIYAKEIDLDSNIVNPRLHFAVPSIPEDDRKSLIGKKEGEIAFKHKDDKIGLEIVEVYNIKKQDK